MDLSIFLAPAVSLIVGFGSSFLGYRAAQKQLNNSERVRRVESFRRYEQIVRDFAIDWEINVVGVPGTHFTPRTEELKKARNDFYLYIHELENHEHYYKLLSPFPDVPNYADPSEAVRFYSDIEEALRRHITKYPKPLRKSPYRNQKDDA